MLLIESVSTCLYPDHPPFQTAGDADQGREITPPGSPLGSAILQHQIMLDMPDPESALIHESNSQAAGYWKSGPETQPHGDEGHCPDQAATAAGAAMISVRFRDACHCDPPRKQKWGCPTPSHVMLSKYALVGWHLLWGKCVALLESQTGLKQSRTLAAEALC